MTADGPVTDAVASAQLREPPQTAQPPQQAALPPLVGPVPSPEPSAAVGEPSAPPPKGAEVEAPSPLPPPVGLSALAKRKPGRPSAFVTSDGNPACQCCGTDLTQGSHKSFHQRYHICEQHMMAQSVERKGTLQRFCQQCGRFHELDAFDPGMRSCRQQLARHAERRRRARAAASAAQASHGQRGPSASSGDSIAATAAMGGPDLLAVIAGGVPDNCMPRATTKRPLLMGEGGRGSPDLDGAHTARLLGSSGSSASAHSGMGALDALVAAAEEEEMHAAEEAAAKRQRTSSPPAVVEPDPSWFLPQPAVAADMPGPAAAFAVAAAQPREAQTSSTGLPPHSMLLAGLPQVPPAGLSTQAAGQQADMQLLLRHLVAPPPPPPVPAPLALLASPTAAAAVALQQQQQQALLTSPTAAAAMALQQQQQQQALLTSPTAAAAVALQQQQQQHQALLSSPTAAAAMALQQQQQQHQVLQQQLAVLAAAGDPIAAAALQAAAVQQAAAAQRAAQEAHMRRLLLAQEQRAAAAQEAQAARLFQAACDAILAGVLAPGRGPRPPAAP